MERRSIHFPEGLWRRVKNAAAQEGAKRGEPVSVSEWIREAVEQRLKKSKERK